MAEIKCHLTEGADFVLEFDDSTKEIVKITCSNDTKQKMRFEITDPKTYKYELENKSSNVNISKSETSAFTVEKRIGKKGVEEDYLTGVNWRVSIGI